MKCVDCCAVYIQQCRFVGVLDEACPQVAMERAGLSGGDAQFEHLQVMSTAMVNHCLQQLSCNPAIAVWGRHIHPPYHATMGHFG